MTSRHYGETQDLAQVRREFYIHAGVYLAVNVFLCALDVLKSPDRLWFYWVAGGWGIGLAFHAARAFGLLDRQHGPKPPGSQFPGNTPP